MSFMFLYLISTSIGYGPLPLHASICDALAPRSYRESEHVAIYANSLTSTAGGLPFPAYSIRTCVPPKESFEAEYAPENISQVLLGEKIQPSLYKASLLHNVTCRPLCRPLALRDKEKANLSRRIDQHYRMNLILDNLPLAERCRNEPLRKSHLPSILKGCPLGFSAGREQSASSKIVYNHLDLEIEYSKVPPSSTSKPFGPEPEPRYRIVGFYGTPRSIRHTPTTCAEDFPLDVSEHDVLTLGPETSAVLWTYSVTWVRTNIQWSTRWDMYLQGSSRDAKIQWVSLFNSMAVLFLLTAMIAMILIRTVRRDLLRYRNLGDSLTCEYMEDTGWKLISGDVFRNPPQAALFALLVGSGAQVLAVLVTATFFALLGFLSPENRGAFLSTFIVCFLILGCVNGYATARFTKMFRIARWSHILKSAFYLPAIMLVLYLPINIIQCFKSSSSGLPVTEVLTLMGCWAFVSCPLVFLGALYSFRRQPLRIPCAVNPIPRVIPPQPWYLRSTKFLLLTGLVPFSAAFVEVVYILSSLWQGRLYCMFGFISLVILIVAITTAEVSVILTYYQLANENYAWWWTSVWASASPGVYLFLYSCYYYATALPMHQISSALVYFGYMSLLSLLLALCTGTIGFFASFQFVRYIYAHVRIE
ncbi:hypothetical protein XU18_4739 [Perkinsela sp. CCAP 1560/4]|nr:hypothetical protein XU18_4739 [Perkinsela sp. CCAP 1560/4]|eukprot:KNH03931.1 hypothetical protein XU18_4739 [Perkinsela sp. CCAP 1560/4]